MNEWEAKVFSEMELLYPAELLEFIQHLIWEFAQDIKFTSEWWAKTAYGSAYIELKDNINAELKKRGIPETL